MITEVKFGVLWKLLGVVIIIIIKDMLKTVRLLCYLLKSLPEHLSKLSLQSYFIQAVDWAPSI